MNEISCLTKMISLTSKKFFCSFSSVNLLRISWFKFAMVFFSASFLQLFGRVRWSATADGVLTGVWHEPSRSLCWCSCHLHRGHLQPDIVADSVWMGKGAQLLPIAVQNARFLTLAIIKTFWIKELLHLGRGRNCGEAFDCKMRACWRLSGIVKIPDLCSKRMPFDVPKQYLIYFAFIRLLFVFGIAFTFSLLVPGMRQCKGDNLPYMGFPKIFPSCRAAVSCMNPQLWPSAPTPENSLQWHRDG